MFFVVHGNARATGNHSREPFRDDGRGTRPDVMTGGRYLFRPIPEVSPVTITATGPDGWVGYRSWAMDAPDPVRANAPNGTGIAFILADGVYKNPCHWDLLGNGEEGQPDVAVGATVDDLVAALRANTLHDL